MVLGPRKRRVDWERGSLRSRSLFLDRRILTHLGFESSIGSRSYDSFLDAYTILQFLLVLLDFSSQQILLNSSISWQSLA